MARMDWGSPVDHYYENGVDRGVLYVDSVGYVWSGLTSVSENPAGGDQRSYYLDGIKYITLAAAEEYEATIASFGAPAAFGDCDGTKSLYNGLYVTQQRRKSFGFTYRTMIGNAIGADQAYKIHIVYNALAAPSQRNNKTQGENAELMDLSWFISAVPPAGAVGFKPSAHFVIDSRFAPAEIMTSIEDMLYGTEEADPYLPSQSDILDLFEVSATLQVTDNFDGTATIIGPDDVVTMIDPDLYEIDYASVVFVGDDTYSISSL